MASEELEQRYPNGKGKKIGQFEVYECQLTTINQFAQNGILPNNDYGTYKTQKPDALIISRIPDPHAVVVGEHKKPGEITDGNWKDIAEDLLESKCKTVGAQIGYVSDGVTTYWINGKASVVTEIIREDGMPLPTRVDYNDKSFATELNYLVNNFDPVTNTVKAKKTMNPHKLAEEVWQSIWRLRADRPEDCLATFVELFVFKFLNDLGLLKTDDTGHDVSLEYVMTKVNREISFAYYESTVRPHIKKLFPPGSDGYSIINGTVLQASNRDHNIMFHEIMKKFIKFGSLKNTDPEFKTRLYESFLQESKTTSTFGQFFTPRKIVSSIHDMAEIDKLPEGQIIYDPASGVGGFILEQMARDLSTQWTLKGKSMRPIHKWLAHEVVPKTTILAKANALVHCGDILADQPSRVPSFAKWLNEVFNCKDNTALGSLEEMYNNKIDLIITNPPFVVSGSSDIGKIVRSDNNRRKYYGQKYSGVEGLFVQFIIKSLKKNGDAWVLLPESFFLRTTDRTLRNWIFKNCKVDFLAILPERTFFTTPKRVMIIHLKRRPQELSGTNIEKVLKSEKTLMFAVSEIGETRDVNRFPCRSDLEQMTQLYRLHKSGLDLTGKSKRAVVTESFNLYDKSSLNVRHFWSREDAIELELTNEGENPIEGLKHLKEQMDSLKKIADSTDKDVILNKAPNKPINLKTVSIGDTNLFSLRIGRRVLKKDIYTNRTGIPLFSANVRKAFGYVHSANAGNLQYGGALWSIDSDFDSRGVSPGEIYSITDHCGEVTILHPNIDPEYLAYQIRQAGAENGFNREYRPSLGVMANLEIQLPIDASGDFDLHIMKEWSDYLEALERRKKELIAALELLK